jgi:hypothetical protein
MKRPNTSTFFFAISLRLEWRVKEKKFAHRSALVFSSVSGHLGLEWQHVLKLYLKLQRLLQAVARLLLLKNENKSLTT